MILLLAAVVVLPLGLLAAYLHSRRLGWTLPDHAPADCPACQYALRPADATGASRTWPVVNVPGLDPWLRHIEPDDPNEPPKD